MKAFYIVHGAVQDVGYRAHVRAAANKHNVNGMVRNMRDGSVEVFACGTPEQIMLFENDINISMQNGPQVFT